MWRGSGEDLGEVLLAVVGFAVFEELVVESAGKIGERGLYRRQPKRAGQQNVNRLAQRCVSSGNVNCIVEIVGISVLRKRKGASREMDMALCRAETLKTCSWI